MVVFPFLNTQGPKSFATLMKIVSELDVGKVKSSEQLQQLITVSLGCLHNVSNDCDQLRDTFYDLKIMLYLRQYGEKYLRTRQ